MVRFDFDPLNLKDPKAESVMTARDLMKDPMTTPYTAEMLAPSLREAEALADRLAKLPEVAQAITAASFVPADQEPKLAILGRSAAADRPDPDARRRRCRTAQRAEIVAAMADLRKALQPVVAREAATVGPRSAAAASRRGSRRAPRRAAPAIIPALQRDLMTGLEAAPRHAAPRHDSRAGDARELAAANCGTAGSPRTARARVEVFPRGDARDNEALRRFVASVRTVAPDVTGTPVTIQEAGRLISSAFREAGVIAVVAITLLLAIVLRRVRDVALVIAPLLLAALLTLAIMVVLGKPLNYANIIALPLLFGIGVAFDIYFVMNWRAGTDESPAVEHRARGRVQRADDNGGVRELWRCRPIRARPRWACC